MAGGDLKTKLRAMFFRRHSSESCSPSAGAADREAQADQRGGSLGSLASRGSRGSPSTNLGRAPSDDEEEDIHDVVETNAPELPRGGGESVVDVVDHVHRRGGGQLGQDQARSDLRETASPSQCQPLDVQVDALLHDNHRHESFSTAGFPTPDTEFPSAPEPEPEPEDHAGHDEHRHDAENIAIQPSSPAASSTTAPRRPSGPSREQSLLPHQQTALIKTLLETELPPQSRTANLDYFADNAASTISADMVSRKMWVKRPGASATLVTIHEGDLVDDVRDMILKKYANTLGRNFDAPDVTLRVAPRENRQERILGPEEPIGRTLDAYFPGGQTVDEALVIDVPVKRTPKHSPQPLPRYYMDEDRRPAEAGSDYFPPMPIPSMPSPHLPGSMPSSGQSGHASNHHLPIASHSMSVLSTGHVPSLPSPGSLRRSHHRERPRLGRQHTPSPTVLNGQGQPPPHNGMQVYPLRHTHSRTHSSASEKSVANAAPPTAPIPTPPPQQQNEISQIQEAAAPPPRISSPRPQSRPKKIKKQSSDHPPLPAGMLNGAVPPINVLIVEDNIINLKLLEAFMKRLKVRWQTAMNGREAVTKWRAGGFHLVLMDIQLPIMSGLEATKEIRRLERLNSIGVFSSTASTTPSATEEVKPEGDDKLPNTVLFKSPVIIVALTASSLQSDRHEALAAGCNDFLTKVRPRFLTPSTTPFLESELTPYTASQLRLARAQGNGMGLHASPDRLRRLAEVERLLARQAGKRAQRRKIQRCRKEKEQGQHWLQPQPSRPSCQYQGGYGA